MTEAWLWNICDDGAPLGSDTGADTFSALRQWRRKHRGADPMGFQHELLLGWEVPDEEWDLQDPVALERRLPAENYAILTRDDVAVATAFAQLVIEGCVSKVVRQRARLALQRQRDPVVLRFRGWRDTEERLHRLRVMLAVVERAEEAGPEPHQRPRGAK